MHRIKIYERNKIIDSRGWFLKVINGKEEGLPPFTGEIYVTCATAGEIKGGHYHNLANEWFTLIEGKCVLMISIVNEPDSYSEMELDAEKPRTIYIPAGFAHAFKNTNESNFILLAYTDQLYNPIDTIPFTF